MATGKVAQEVGRVVERLGLRVVGRRDYRLIDVVKGFIVPNWHPCPCSHTPEERVVVERHLEDLASRGEMLLSPVVVATVLGVKVILAPTCVAEAAQVMYRNGRRDVLEGVRAEVWDLGEFNEPFLAFLAKAAAALFCIVYGGRRHSEVRLSFVEDYIKHRVLEIAEKSGKDEAFRFIEGLEQRRDVMLLVDELARITGLSGREIHRYLSAVLNDQFIKELRGLVRNADEIMAIIDNMRRSRDGEGKTWPMVRLYINTISNKLNIDSSNLKPLAILGKGSLEMLARTVVELVNGGNEGGARDLVTKVLRYLEVGEVDRVVELISERYGEVIEAKAPSTTVQAREPTHGPNAVIADTARLSIEDVGPGQGVGEVGMGKGVSEVTENEEGGAEDTEGAEVGVLFRRSFEFACSEDTCTHISELSRASREGDAKAMLEASLALSSVLANTLGMGSYARLLDELTRHLGDEGFANALLGVLETYNGNETTIKHLMELLGDPNIVNALLAVGNGIRDLLRAVESGDVGVTCEAVQYLVADLVRNLLPSNLRSHINLRLNCS